MWSTGLLSFYLAQSFLVLILLRRRKQSTTSFRLLVHLGDVVWPALISAFAAGQGTPFFLLFVFVLAAAAYRWGLWETVERRGRFYSVCGRRAWRFTWAWRTGWMHLLRRHNLPPLMINVASFQPRALFMRSIYLMVLGLLLGYLAEQQKQLRAEKAVIARTLGLARVKSGMTGTLHEILGDLLSSYGAKHAVIASLESNSRHIFVGQLRSLSSTPTVFHWLEPSQADREIYLYESPAEACYVRWGGRRHRALVGLDHDGTRIRELSRAVFDGISKKHECRSLIAVSFVFGSDWSGRIFLLDPVLHGDIEEELRFLQELVRQVGPAVYNVYLLRRLRRRAGALERLALPANCMMEPCSR